MRSDPVVATLDTPTLLDPTKSDDNVVVRLPNRLPTDITARPLLLAPCALRHLAAESDSHVVSSQAVVTARAPAELPASPRPPPCSVRLTDPDAAWLARLITLSCSASMVATCVVLPDLNPTVSADRKLLASFIPVRHRVDVSDSQDVISHAVPPALSP